MPHSDHHHVNHYNRAFALGVTLNIIFACAEVYYGMTAKSLALIADAGHNFSDVLSLVLAWGATIIGKKSATEKRTYGFRKITIMASLVSALLLLFTMGGIAWETIGRFYNPKPVESMTIIMVASIGVVINTLTALLFVSGHKHDLNIKAAFLHMAADAAVSLGVVFAGVIILYTGWLYVDSIISLVIVAIIVFSTVILLRDSMNLAIDSVPRDIDMRKLKKYLNSCTGVMQIHDLHVWSMSTTEVALSVHVIIEGDVLSKGFIPRLQQELHDRFKIRHSTIQIEYKDDVPCELNKNGCI